MKKLKHKHYEIKKYTWFNNPETRKIEQKIITQRAYTRIGFLLKIFFAMLAYDDVDYEIIF